MKWMVIGVGPDEAHIVPKADSVEHVLNDECICEPVTTYLEEGNKMLTHNSFDGRELREPKRAK